MTKKQTVSVRLDLQSAHRLARAAELIGQSRAAFLEKAGEEAARRLLLDWAVARHRLGEASFSELAQETGLALEEVIAAASSRDREAALEMFLASCRTIAETQGDPSFLRRAEEAVASLREAEAA